MTQYRNAPLIELIAELRWDIPNALGLPPGLVLPPGISPAQIPFFGFDQSRIDSFFMRFSGEAYKAGVPLQHVERTVPSGLPLAPGQVVHRFKSEPSSAEIYQIGGGVFTANAVPPYHSWTKFKPFLEKGIDLLLLARPEDEAKAQLQVSLQYVDAYGPSITQGLTSEKFIQEKLGLKVSVPQAIESLFAVDGNRALSLQFNAELGSNLVMFMSVSDGAVANEPAVIVHTNIQTTVKVEASKDSIMEALNAAQDIQHKIFEGFIPNIKNLVE